MWKYYALLAALFAALTAVFSKLGVKNVDSNLATAIRVSFILILTWGIVFSSNIHHGLLTIPRKTWFYLFLSAIATGLSWLCYFKALSLGDVSKVAPLDKLSVPLVIIISVIFLGEPLTWQVIAGGLLITCGAIILII